MWKKSNWYFWHFGSRATSSQPRTPRMGSKSWIYFRIVSKSLVFDWSANANRSDWLNAYWNVKKPSLDSLLVLVMFGVSPTCVTKMVVVPFLFLIYWCAFLVEFQESNFNWIPSKLEALILIRYTSNFIRTYHEPWRLRCKSNRI